MHVSKTGRFSKRELAIMRMLKFFPVNMAFTRQYSYNSRVNHLTMCAGTS
jgi:hypothetical protein